MPFKRLLMLFALPCLIPLVSGCSSVNSALGGNTEKEAQAEVNWDYARHAIQIELSSNEDLNAYLGQAHTMVLGVFQVADAKAFTALLQDSDKIRQTLSSGDAGADVLHVDRYVISPGKHTILNLDRVQDSRYVGLIAGYYDLQPDGAARLFRIPLNIKTSGIISTTYAAAPAHLALRLQLGRQRIVNAQSLTFDAEQKPTVETISLDNENLNVDLDKQTLDAAGESATAARKLRK